jgi:GTP cyclohydrolase I
MEALELDVSDPHLRGTEWRVAKAYDELLRGLSRDSEPLLRTFPNEEGYSAPVSMTGIPFYSLCAHHLLPFFGEAHIIYMPTDRVVGLSKLARAVGHVARRPQVQERLTEQLVQLLDQRLEPKGVMVVVEARHLCMEMRGARSVGVTTTSAARGIFADADRRKEFLDELRSGRSRNVDSRILR